ncbi:high mobility group protein Z [Nissabacter sp. SGAir0207]|nr:high mobility group protein Z [Nissabacter sp. SGAir0207]
MCYLVGLLSKLWRLSQRKARLRSATAVRMMRSSPLPRRGRQRSRKE